MTACNGAPSTLGVRAVAFPGTLFEESMESPMSSVLRGVVRNGRIETMEPLTAEEGTEVLVAIPGKGDSDDALWRLTAHALLERAWDPSDDVYDALSKG